VLFHGSPCGSPRRKIPSHFAPQRHLPPLCPDPPRARARGTIPAARHCPPPDCPARTPEPGRPSPDHPPQRRFRVPSGPDAGPGGGGFPPPVGLGPIGRAGGPTERLIRALHNKVNGLGEIQRRVPKGAFGPEGLRPRRSEGLCQARALRKLARNPSEMGEKVPRGVGGYEFKARTARLAHIPSPARPRPDRTARGARGFAVHCFTTEVIARIRPTISCASSSRKRLCHRPRIVPQAADKVKGYRFDANLWDQSLPRRPPCRLQNASAAKLRMRAAPIPRGILLGASQDSSFSR
jgi:hypothetical protein